MCNKYTINEQENASLPPFYVPKVFPSAYKKRGNEFFRPLVLLYDILFYNISVKKFFEVTYYNFKTFLFCTITDI